MSIVQGNNIHFFQGIKSSLEQNIDNMIDGDLAIATDEMQWYLFKDGELKLIGYQPPEEDQN